MRLALIFPIAACALAQSGLNPPSLGWMLDAQHNMRPVYGIAGNAIASGVAESKVRSFACSSQLCVMKTEASVVAGSQSISAPQGDAKIAIGDSQIYFYFPAVNQLSVWSSGALETIPFDARQLGGEVLSLGSGSPGSLDIAIRSKDRDTRIARLDLTSGAIRMIDSLPAESGPVILLKDAVLYASDGVVVLRRPDASELRFPVAQAREFFAMSDQWVEVVAAKEHWAIRVTPGREQAMLLPEISQ